MSLAVTVPHHQLLQSFTLQSLTGSQTPGANGLTGTPATSGGLAGVQVVQLDGDSTFPVIVQLEGSFDNTNWFALGYQQIDAQATLTRSVSAITVTATQHHTYQILDLYKYVRARVTQINSVTTATTLGGTFTATLWGVAE